MNGKLSTLWLILLGGACAVGLALVTASGLSGLPAMVLMVVLALGVLVSFAALVSRAARRPDR
ncbi:hypothetical protein HCN51_09195 [Nonomuraea sp. FMUSA5-5]|uniref:DUF2207 domain-containing protein n=1 Tax=Nonomuraea composti TaxID=2720023 RepID=A0ABX1AVF4_9ACTN|nr:hypothetical protein [Nonomuraea sp. FMUSA5-5]NJP89618.1 hypothetical protein [Nonomuraea sp. FMUSA5-5]